MPQFAVHQNADSAGRREVPYLLDVQSDLLADMGTRVVVPLFSAVVMKGRTQGTLTPQFEVDGKQVVMVTQQIAGIARKHLGPQTSSLSEHRQTILAALDMLITGI
jgi:toxin CcdB